MKVLSALSLSEVIKKNNAWNITRLVDGSFVSSTQRPSILYIEDCRIFVLLKLCYLYERRKCINGLKKITEFAFESQNILIFQVLSLLYFKQHKVSFKLLKFEQKKLSFFLSPSLKFTNRYCHSGGAVGGPL